MLAQLPHPVPLCADESCHDVASLARIAGCYEMVNIKLDKSGGLTEALRVKAEAGRLGLQVMVGCMVATSLSMAPAVVVAQGASVIDLDGPLLLAKDREHGLHYEGSELFRRQPCDAVNQGEGDVTHGICERRVSAGRGGENIGFRSRVFICRRGVKSRRWLTGSWSILTATMCGWCAPAPSWV